MRILHATEVVKGGPATHLRELLPHQVSRYERVSLLCREEECELLGEIPGLKIIPVAGVARTAAGLARLGAAIKRHARDHDIIHLHSSFAGLMGRVLVSTRSKHIVYCARGWSFAMDRPPLLKSAYAMVERLLSYNTDAIINISKKEHFLAKEYSLPEQKMTVVYNGISDCAWRPLDSTRARRLLFVGRYDEQKGVDLLIDAYPQLRDLGFSLTLIGGHVVGRTQIASVPDEVTELGWKRPDEIAKAMNEADAVIMPSRWEGFGFVAIEAMRAARPVLAANTGGLSEIVVDGETGFHFKPGNAAAIVDAATRLAKADARALGLAGRIRYEAMFSSTTMRHMIDEIYSRVGT